MDGHGQADGTIRDFCDGTEFQKSSLFSSDDTAFQLILYYDELELCNPLGSHKKKHKIGIRGGAGGWVGVQTAFESMYD